MHPHGDPDNVDGWYSKKLSYSEWYELACAKRAHQEQVESTPVATVFTLLGAIKYPRVALGAGAVYLIGMYVFSKSYKKHGANTGVKCLGRIMTKSALWVLAGAAFASTWVLMKDHKSAEWFTDLFSF